MLGCPAASPALVISPFSPHAVEAAEMSVSALHLLYLQGVVTFCCGETRCVSIFTRDI